MMAELHHPAIVVGADWPEAARIRDLHYALGWFIGDVGGAHLIYHNGANPGIRASIFFVPSAKAGIVILTNGESNTFPTTATRVLLEELFR